MFTFMKNWWINSNGIKNGVYSIQQEKLNLDINMNMNMSKDRLISLLHFLFGGYCKIWCCWEREKKRKKNSKKLNVSVDVESGYKVKIKKRENKMKMWKVHSYNLIKEIDTIYTSNSYTCNEKLLLILCWLWQIWCITFARPIQVYFIQSKTSLSSLWAIPTKNAPTAQYATFYIKRYYIYTWR